MKCAAVILAAGASTRFGAPKQLAKVEGEFLLQRAIRVCREAKFVPIVVVLGAHAETIRVAVDLAETQIVLNEDWREGMGSSLREGARELAECEVEATLVLTCDMPFVSAAHLTALVGAAEKANRSTASRYGGRNGVPACFLRADFAALMNAGGDQGARALLQSAPFVSLQDSSDVDTQEDLAAVRLRSAG